MTNIFMIVTILILGLAIGGVCLLAFLAMLASDV
jgi:hypothetical protein